MVEKLVVGVAQWLPEPGGPDRNLETALATIETLAGRGCDLVVLPELWACGLCPASLKADLARCAEPLDGPRARRLSEAARHFGIWLAAGSVPEAEGKRVFNTAMLFARDGTLVATHRKCHLYTPLGEHLACAQGDSLTVAETDELGTVGLSICFDGDFPEVARAMRRRGARLVIHPSAYEVGAAAWWDTLYPANALANGQWWVMANQCGSTGGETYLGGSQIVAPTGKVVAAAVRAAPGETPEPALLVAELELAAGLARADRDNAALWENARPELYEP